MLKFTVILHYPDNGERSKETYIAEVEISSPLVSPDAVIASAQHQASEANDGIIPPEDFEHIATFHGHCAQYV